MAQPQPHFGITGKKNNLKEGDLGGVFTYEGDAKTHTNPRCVHCLG